MRNYEGENNREEYEVITLKLKLCKTVCYEAADKGLDQSGASRQEQRIGKRFKISVFCPYRLLNIKREFLRNKSYGNVNEVIR